MLSPRFSVLKLEYLDDRITPSLTIQFDYSFDTNRFFDDPARRAVIEKAGQDLASRIETTLGEIRPANGNAWTASFFHPGTGEQVRVPNLQVPEGSIIVYVGGRALRSAEAGEGGSGGYSISGDATWINQVQKRNHQGFSLWGGSISFDTTQPWYFGLDTAGLRTSQIDLYSVAVHELGHVLGFGTASEFSSAIHGQQFQGATTILSNGGNTVSLSSDLAHWENGTKSHGEYTSMQPYILFGKRQEFTNLDYAALADLGWNITSPPPVTLPGPQPIVPSVPPVVTPVPVLTPPTGSLLPGGANLDQVIAVGSNLGTVRLVDLSSSSPTSPSGPSFQPFPGFKGEIRSTLADVTGDGKPELIVATGPGSAQVRIVDPVTGLDIVPAFSPFEASFDGGLFVSAADISGDGRAEIVVTPDLGGGPRVTGFTIAGQQVVTVINFFGIEDQNFRGGARIALGDLNQDGKADVIVAAGVGGGPRIAVWDGRTAMQPAPSRLTGDFFAYGKDDSAQLRNGVYISVGDFDSDGRADLAVGGGPGAGPRITVWKGSELLKGNSSALADMFAFDPSQRNGVRVGVHSIAGRNILVSSTVGGDLSQLKTYEWIQGGENRGAQVQEKALNLSQFADFIHGIFVS